MIAPVKALVASLQTILTSRIDDLEAQRTALMARTDDRLRHSVNNFDGCECRNPSSISMIFSVESCSKK